MSEIVIADLVPLSERGLYQGFLGFIWTVAFLCGPIIVRHLTFASLSLYDHFCLGRCLCEQQTFYLEGYFLCVQFSTVSLLAPLNSTLIVRYELAFDWDLDAPVPIFYEPQNSARKFHRENETNRLGVRCTISSHFSYSYPGFSMWDYSGNVFIMASTTSVLLGLTWGGVQFPWSSPHVLVPLVLGLVGMLAFLVYEARVASVPSVPLRLLKTRTIVSG